MNAINGMDRVAFVQKFGGIFEKSPWVAEKAWEKRPAERLRDHAAPPRRDLGKGVHRRTAAIGAISGTPLRGPAKIVAYLVATFRP
jgi:hypothetical protein